jgi:type II secretory pathway predicted ATPase ExeA
MAPLLEQARAVEKPAFIIVDDADAADGAELERIRIAVECAPDAIKWLRIVLVGGEGLERSLNDPAASALASRLCARVRLAPEPRIPPPAPASAPVRLAALAAFAVAFASLGAWS